MFPAVVTYLFILQYLTNYMNLETYLQEVQYWTERAFNQEDVDRERVKELTKQKVIQEFPIGSIAPLYYYMARNDLYEKVSNGPNIDNLTLILEKVSKEKINEEEFESINRKRQEIATKFNTQNKAIISLDCAIYVAKLKNTNLPPLTIEQDSEYDVKILASFYGMEFDYHDPSIT